MMLSAMLFFLVVFLFFYLFDDALSRETPLVAEPVARTSPMPWIPVTRWQVARL